MISDNQKTELASELRNLSLLLSSDVTREVIAAYVRLLVGSNFKFEDIKNSIHKAALECEFFPKPKKLIELMNPVLSKEDANAIVNNIFISIKKFGYLEGEKAKVYLGPTAWSTVLASGGWREVCFYEGSEGIQKAQMRDMALSVMDSVNVTKRINQRDKKILKENPDFKLLSFDSDGIFRNKDEA